jgi:hypothetical protein
MAGSKAMTPAQELATYWNAFCDSAAVPEGFIDRMESAGFAEVRQAEATDVEATMAAPRGAMIWCLTATGLAAFKWQPR